MSRRRKPARRKKSLPWKLTLQFFRLLSRHTRKRRPAYRRYLLSTVALPILLSSCISTAQPQNTANVCSMFEDRRAWYKAAERSQDRWGVPVHVSMAFIQQESTYQARVRPPRTKVLWVIPWKRPSSAFGYAQALDGTWEDYRRTTGNLSARRSNFADAIDFIGWYNRTSIDVNQIPSHDAERLYLAYHQGHTGYARGTYADNPALQTTAKRVAANAQRYQTQYTQCQQALGRNWFMRLIS